MPRLEGGAEEKVPSRQSPCYDRKRYGSYKGDFTHASHNNTFLRYVNKAVCDYAPAVMYPLSLGKYDPSLTRELREGDEITLYFPNHISHQPLRFSFAHLDVGKNHFRTHEGGQFGAMPKTSSFKVVIEFPGQTPSSSSSTSSKVLYGITQIQLRVKNGHYASCGGADTGNDLFNNFLGLFVDAMDSCHRLNAKSSPDTIFTMEPGEGVKYGNYSRKGDAVSYGDVVYLKRGGQYLSPYVNGGMWYCDLNSNDCRGGLIAPDAKPNAACMILGPNGTLYKDSKKFESAEHNDKIRVLRVQDPTQSTVIDTVNSVGTFFWMTGKLFWLLSLPFGIGPKLLALKDKF